MSSGPFCVIIIFVCKFEELLGLSVCTLSTTTQRNNKHYFLCGLKTLKQVFSYFLIEGFINKLISYKLLSKAVEKI